MSNALPTVAIVGQTGVGKSSLFNRLLGQSRSIVAQESHTTRNRVQAIIPNRGHPFWLVDTAGVGTLIATSKAEQELADSIKQQLAAVQDSADILVVVVDGTKPLSDSDRAIAKSTLKTGRPVILVVNKLDQPKAAVSLDFKRTGIKTIVGVSALHNHGLAELLTQLDQFLPKARLDSHAPTFSLALVGRPNVGKSALFNALSSRSAAIVSEVAGTTRDVNTMDLTQGDQSIRLFDTGGVRKPGKRVGIEQFSYLRTLWAIEQADVAALVVEPGAITAIDQKVAALVKDMGRGLVVVINKWDLMTDQPSARSQIENSLKRQFNFVPWAPVVLASALTGLNLAKLIELAGQAADRRKTTIDQDRLSRWLADTISHHPPAGLKNRQPKLTTIEQVASQPPQLMIMGKDVEWLHWSYKRYLENQLRAEFDLIGTPVTLKFKS